jgi:hypothetical protein
MAPEQKMLFRQAAIKEVHIQGSVDIISTKGACRAAHDEPRSRQPLAQKHADKENAHHLKQCIVTLLLHRHIQCMLLLLLLQLLQLPKVSIVP